MNFVCLCSCVRAVDFFAKIATLDHVSLSMTCPEITRQLNKNDIDTNTLYFAAFDESSMCVGVARLGADDQVIKAGTLQQLCDVDMGPPLHSLIIAGTMHHIEAEMLKQYLVDGADATVLEQL